MGAKKGLSREDREHIRGRLLEGVHPSDVVEELVRQGLSVKRAESVVRRVDDEVQRELRGGRQHRPQDQVELRRAERDLLIGAVAAAMGAFLLGMSFDAAGQRLTGGLSFVGGIAWTLRAMPRIRARGGAPTRLGAMVAIGVFLAGCAGYFWYRSHREGLERRGVRVTVVSVWVGFPGC